MAELNDKKQMIKSSNKKSKLPAILILVIFLLCIAIGFLLLFTFSVKQQPNEEEVVSAQELINLDSLRDQVLAIDLVNNYPQSVAELMEVYTNTFRLLYLWDMEDTETLSRVLAVQRGLYSPALLNANPFERQLSSLLFSRNELNNNEVGITGVHLGTTTYDRFTPDSRATVTLVKFTTENKSFTYVYEIFKNPNVDKWQIGTWAELQ